MVAETPNRVPKRKLISEPKHGTHIIILSCALFLISWGWLCSVAILPQALVMHFFQFLMKRSTNNPPLRFDVACLDEQHLFLNQVEKVVDVLRAGRFVMDAFDTLTTRHQTD
jgi:hypothetical protein